MPVRLRLLPGLPTLGPPTSPGGGRGPTEERTIELPDDTTEIRIGRRPDVELPLPYPALSAVHARLVRGETGWRIEDLGSTNGTRLDGQKLTPRQPRAIPPGAEIVLAQIRLVFDGTVTSVGGAERTATIARRLVSDLFAASPDLAMPSVAITGGVPTRAPLRLETIDRRYLAGRGETCDLRLASEEISREHLEIVRQWDGVVVMDLGSKNGVRVNETLLAGPRRLRDGDVIQVGPATLRLSDPADRYLREFEARAAKTDGEGQVADPAPAAGTEPVAPGPAPTPAAAPAPPTAPKPTPRPGGSRTAIIVAGVVLIVVAAVVAGLVFGS
jgi:pSer/pThr/pTyr-binding forkhead associated (FHA) protein